MTKVALDNVVTYIRVVWDCRVNGHNETLWQPGFRLPTFQDATDMVVKSLSIPVGDYLEQGSTVMKYTQDVGRFIKTFQGDVDLGVMFNNFFPTSLRDTPWGCALCTLMLWRARSLKRLKGFVS